VIRSPGAVLTNIPGTTLFVRSPENADLPEYYRVEMGPIPGKPAWHQGMYDEQSYPFLGLDAATRFAQSHKATHPRRDVVIVYPDGPRWDGKAWVA